MDDLSMEIKKLIISTLELEDVHPDQIDDDEALFGSGLGLDSIDALELGIALFRKFKVSFIADSEEMKKCFASVNALASYIQSQRGTI